MVIFPLHRRQRFSCRNVVETENAQLPPLCFERPRREAHSREVQRVPRKTIGRSSGETRPRGAVVVEASASSAGRKESETKKRGGETNQKGQQRPPRQDQKHEYILDPIKTTPWNSVRRLSKSSCRHVDEKNEKAEQSEPRSLASIAKGTLSQLVLPQITFREETSDKSAYRQPYKSIRREISMGSADAIGSFMLSDKRRHSKTARDVQRGRKLASFQKRTSHGEDVDAYICGYWTVYKSQNRRERSSLQRQPRPPQSSLRI